MNRRNAFKVMFGGLLVWLGWWSVQAKAHQVIGPLDSHPFGQGFKRIFRVADDGLWREIAWESMRAGDSIVSIDVADGMSLKVEAWKVLSFDGGFRAELDGTVQNLLPEAVDRK